MQTNGILYICPTPIGNLEDITLRVIRILKEVDIIACEDTRVTQKLLNHYEIKTKLTSYHKFSEKEKSQYLIDLINKGKNIALVSDAGTPLISDPGGELLKLAHQNNIKTVPIPGPCAVITALSASYLDSSNFVFIGFLAKSRKEKETLLSKYQDINIIFYESPHRLVRTLEEILEIAGNKTVIVARELTKIYEEIRRDSVENQIIYYSQKVPKGEIAIIIEASPLNKLTPDQIELVEKIKVLEKENYSTKEISKILSILTGFPKGKIYELAVSLKEAKE